MSGETWLALVLALVALLVLAPAVLTLLTTTAQYSEEELVTRLRGIEQHARADGMVYVLSFRPGSGAIGVTRWRPAHDADLAVAEAVPALSFILSNDTVVQNTTFPDHHLTISENGFPLTLGHVTLRANDGTQTQVTVGDGG